MARYCFFYKFDNYLNYTDKSNAEFHPPKMLNVLNDQRKQALGRHVNVVQMDFSGISIAANERGKT